MLIQAKFSSKCGGCGGAIAEGERISWTRGSKVVFHAACSSEGRQAAQVVQASRAVTSDVELAVPKGLNYFPFQRAGIEFALGLERIGKTGVLWGDEMGLGKTIQVIGWINNNLEIKSVLVVCPKSLIYNWIREFGKWMVRPMMASNRPNSGAPIVVINYEMAVKYREALASREWDMLVADEAHYIKNLKSQRSKTVAVLCERSKRVSMVTGTPIPNRTIEAFSLVSLCDPDEWNYKGKGFFSFALRYANANQDTGYWDFSGASNLEELQQRMRASCLIRRLKSEVLTELPPKLRQVIELPAKGASAAIKAEAAAWERTEARLEPLRVAVELAKASEDPEEFANAVKSLNKASATAFMEMSKLRHAVALAKVPYVADMARDFLEGNEGEKLIIWGHHHDVLDQLREKLGEFGVVGIDGRMGAEERDAAVSAFQANPAIRVFVGGMTAAGVGITLTAASTEMFSELDWVPGTMLQAEDRAHRIGATKSVLVQMLVLEGSLDARMAQVLIQKMEIAERALDRRPEIAKRVTLPSVQPATSGSVRELHELAKGLSAADVVEIHNGLRVLAGNCDGAVQLDGAGFSRIDAAIGHSLANVGRLTAKQAALGLRLCRKYRRQLGEGCWSRGKNG